MVNLRLLLELYDLQVEISSLFNLLTQNLGPASWRFSMQCLSKLWRGTGVSSVCLSRSTPTSLRCSRLGSWGFARLNPELRTSKVGSYVSASTTPIDKWSPKASTSLKVGERALKSLMASHDHPVLDCPSPRMENFSTLSGGRAALHAAQMLSFCQGLVPAGCGWRP